MNGVSGVQDSGSFYPHQQVDQTKHIRFENALAAARTAESNSSLSDPGLHHIDQVDFASTLPAAKHPPAIMGAKMIQSLNKLIQNNLSGNYGTLDIRQ
ncbi:MAG: hypothetical protein ACI8V2_001163 [Candidatus Latescibacterota bacterium]|jgi:hypothetical protein